MSVALLVVISGVALAAEAYMSAADFDSKVVGKTLSSVTKKGKKFTAQFAAGGGGTFKIKGMDAVDFTWSFSGDTMCWEVYNNKECNHVVSKGAKLDFVDAKTGKVNNSYSVAG